MPARPRRVLTLLVLAAVAAGPATAAPITAPLQALPENPHYFTDGSGRAVYLTGSQTWNTVQDWGTNGSIQPLDFTAFVNFLVRHHHNFTLLWTTELPTFRALPTTASAPPDFTVTPFPWERSGPGTASDGRAKFDLRRFKQPFFDRLRARVRKLSDAGIYAGVYPFTGEWLLRFRFAGDGYPFTGSNNVNGVDDGGACWSVTMTATNTITKFQDAYLKKLVETLAGLPNVLWIVSEEAPKESAWWNAHVIATIRAEEAGKPFQHPIGFAVMDSSSDAVLLDSDADWIAPGARFSATTACGSGHPACKVTINDSDHSYWEIWRDTPEVNRNFFWINFTRGAQTIFMDPYLVDYPRQNRNHPPHPVNGIGSGPDPRWERVRATMGLIHDLADRLNLAAMTPRSDLASTGHALASASAAKPELVIYAPAGGDFKVNLTGFRGTFAVEWLNPETGKTSAGKDVKGGATRTFSPPFDHDAALWLKAR